MPLIERVRARRGVEWGRLGMLERGSAGRARMDDEDRLTLLLGIEMMGRGRRERVLCRHLDARAL